MENKTLDQIKSNLDEITKNFDNNTRYALINANVDERTSDLICDICSEVSDALEQMASNIKEAIDMVSK